MFPVTKHFCQLKAEHTNMDVIFSVYNFRKSVPLK